MFQYTLDFKKKVNYNCDDTTLTVPVIYPLPINICTTILLPKLETNISKYVNVETVELFEIRTCPTSLSHKLNLL